ncbi:hypothetical protein R2R32_02765 [Clostridium perfringens]|nr:hypothetical protein [Clostridium perfringens]
MYKMYSIFTLISGIIMTPLWSGFTHAYVNKEFKWISKVILKLIILIIPLIIGCVLVLLLRNEIITIWMGVNIDIPFFLGVFLGISTILTIWSNIFAYFLNGVGILKGQLITVGIGAIINIPLSYIFSVIFNMGSSGVAFASSISLLIFSIYGPLKVYRILKDSEKI